MQARQIKNQVKSGTERASGEPLKYRQLADHFIERIRSGQLVPGTQLPTFAQMNEQHSASRSTVEKMLLILEREKLIERQNGNGIFVASSGRRSTQGVIGLSGEGFSFNGYSTYWSQIMGGVRDGAAQAGLQVLILDPKSHKGWEKADGVLLCDWNDPQAPRQRPLDLPMVSLLAPIEDIASVVADDEGGMYAATQQLIKLGHRRIAYIHGHQDTVVKRRMAGYRRALAEENIVAAEQWTRWLYGRYDVGEKFTKEAREHMQLWLRDNWSTLGCTALLCHNDEAALGAMQALAEKGIRVPEDVSVMGFDGTEFCDLISPQLSSVQLPLREIGAVGVQLLLKQIAADEVSEEHRVLPTQLRMRESTSAPSHHS